MNIVSKGFISAAVADYNSGHYIHMPEFQDQWLDLLNRDVSILNLIPSVPATGHPTRYWEQTKIARNAKWADPRNPGASVSDTDYGRQEKYAPIKAMESRLTFTLFDRQVMEQQGKLAFLIAKDENDWMVDFRQFKNDAIWNGLASKVDAPAVDGHEKEYCGILKQVTKTSSVPANTTIATAIRTAMAKRAADKVYKAFPNVIAANPVSIDLLEQEELAADYNYRPLEVEIIPGIKVPGIRTMIGVLPILPDPYIPVEDTGTALKHKFVLLNKNLLERHYIGSETPQIFQMGMTDDILNDRVMIDFDTIIVKGADKAHEIITKDVAKA